MKVLDILLSDDALERIEAGVCSKAEMEAYSIQFIVELTGNSFAASRRQPLYDALRAGKVDPRATIVYQDKFGRLRSNALAHLLVRDHRGWGVDEDVIADVVQRCGVAFCNEDGKPLFVEAFERAGKHFNADAAAWNACEREAMQEGLSFDWDIPYYEVPSQIRGAEGGKARLYASYVNHLLWQYDALTKDASFPAGAVSDSNVKRVMSLGALSNADYVRDENVKIFADRFREDVDALRHAIAQHDTNAVNDLVHHHHVVRKLYMLGEAGHWCRREAWGEFWDVGYAALLQLPQWAQQQFAPELTRELSATMPHTAVQHWQMDGSVAQRGRGV